MGDRAQGEAKKEKRMVVSSSSRPQPRASDARFGVQRAADARPRPGEALGSQHLQRHIEHHKSGERGAGPKPIDFASPSSALCSACLGSPRCSPAC